MIWRPYPIRMIVHIRNVCFTTLPFDAYAPNGSIFTFFRELYCPFRYFCF